MTQNKLSTDKEFLADPAKLSALLDKYPWFTTARIRRSAITGTHDPALSLNLLTKPWPAGMLHDTGNGYIAEELSDQKGAGADATTEIIDRFLAGGDKRVVPKGDTPVGNIAEDSSVFVPDEEDLDTEELERIYRDQGLELMNDEVSEMMGEVLGEVTEE